MEVVLKKKVTEYGFYDLLSKVYHLRGFYCIWEYAISNLPSIMEDVSNFVDFTATTN